MHTISNEYTIRGKTDLDPEFVHEQLKAAIKATLVRLNESGVIKNGSIEECYENDWEEDEED